MTLSSAATPIVLHSSHFVVLCLARISEISFFLEELSVACRVSGLGATREPSVFLTSLSCHRPMWFIACSKCISEVTSETP